MQNFTVQELDIAYCPNYKFLNSKLQQPSLEKLRVALENSGTQNQDILRQFGAENAKLVLARRESLSTT